MTPRESDLPLQRAEVKRQFTRLLHSRPLLLAAEAARPAACHLVGGALRDAALGFEFRDLDLIIEADGQSFARRVAATLPARLVELGGDRFAAYRLVADGLTLDIWDRQGASLQADLARRDLTIHSFAVELPGGRIIDPFDGLVDLEDNILRATSETSFASDPLRVLRLARFAGQLPDFSVTDRTLVLAVASAANLDQVARERIRVELECLLASPGFLSAAELLVQLRLYPSLWQSRTGQRELSLDSEELMVRMRRLELFADHTRERVERAEARHALLLANLPMGAEETAADSVEICHREGLLTRATAKRLKRLLRSNRLPTETVDRRWFLHQNGSLWPTAACLTAARDAPPRTLAEYQESLARLDALCLEYGNEIFAPEPLVTGTDLVSLLGLQEGKLLGLILAAIQRRQVEGELASRDDALALAKELALERPSSMD